MQFKDIVGHQYLKDHLINTVRDNRVSHAQLFLGPTGSASLAMALAYAQYINCEDKQIDDSCGTCASCRKYNKIIHPDLHFSYPFIASKKDETATDYIDKWREMVTQHPYFDLELWRNTLDVENKQVNINIAEAHSIIKKLSLKAFEAEYKVLIMWLPEYLDTQGNALLKLIEEPPAKTLFLLVAENQDKILNTIISRTQLVKINKYSNQEVSDYLVQKFNIDQSKATEISFIADGNMQEAINLVESSHNDNFELLVDWLRHIATDNGIGFMNDVDDTLSKLGRENQKTFLMYAINIFRQIIFMKENLSDWVHLPAQEKDFVGKFAQHYSLQQIEACINLLEKTHYSVERNANPKILFLDLSLQLVLIFKYKSFPKETQYI